MHGHRCFHGPKRRTEIGGLRLSYVALYRIWRPRHWDDVVNQRSVIRILKNALAEGKVSHAYLFSGPRGTGKTTVARILAKAVNCSNRQGTEPCDQCSSCKAISDGSSVDVIEIDAASNRGIDEIRSLRESVRYMPVSGKYRVYIIDEVHMLTQEAFNALLKTLEEPPEHVIFVMATTAPHKIPITITSRCQRLEFHRLNIQDIEGQLRKILDSQGASYEPNALRVISRAAQGSMRDALSILDLCLTYGSGSLAEADVREVLGEASTDVMLRLFRALSQSDLKTVFEITRELNDRGKDMQELVNEMGAFARDLLWLRSGGKGEETGRTTEELSQMLPLSKVFSAGTLVLIMNILAKTTAGLRNADNPRLWVEMSLMELFMGESAPLSLSVPEVALPEAVAQDVTQKSEPAPEQMVHSGAQQEAVDSAALFAKIQEAWPRVLEYLMKSKKVQARAYLLPSKPSRLEGGKTLFVAYPKGYVTHMEQILSAPHKRVVENAIYKCAGVKCELAVETTDVAVQGGNGGEVHPLVKAAVEMFNGKIESQEG